MWEWLSKLFSNSAGGGGFSDIPTPEGRNPGAPAGGNPFDWGGAFRDIGRELAPGIGQAAVGGLSSLMFPGQGAKVVGTDPRTSVMQGAEDIRLNTARTASNQLQSSFTSPYGALTPAEQERIRRQRRNVDAARGMLDTGGSGSRAMEDLETANTQRQRELYGNINSLTGGYTPLAVSSMAPQESGWAKLLTTALAKPAGSAFQRLFDRWTL